jgi:hypothetical protein
MTEIDASQDPAEHLLAFIDHRRRPDGTTERAPITLDAAAADFAAMIEAGRRAESLLERDYPADDTVGLSSARGKVIATLLEELALRTEPGRAVGPLRSDGALSDLALSISRYLRTGY